LRGIPNKLADTSIKKNLAAVRERMAAAARAAGRDPDQIALIAVSKTKPASAVVEALAAGQVHFAENYVQEALAKISEVARLAPASRPVWHFIGAVQTNKTRDLAGWFDWVHTIEREKVARRLDAQCPPGKRLNVCLQVNVDRDPNKSGVAPERVGELLEACLKFPNLSVRGLMTILDPRSEARAGYNRLRELFEALARTDVPSWDTLSMGMSGDYPAAIEAGATFVRVGTAVFGPRAPRQGLPDQQDRSRN
jgi:pyridoxal phosphate enzyme (YggS family)